MDKDLSDLPITSKPSESRMGKGKGVVSHYKVKAGQFIFEMCGISESLALTAFNAQIKITFQDNSLLLVYF